MDQRRQIVSTVVAVACFLVWLQVAPILFPNFFKPPAAVPPQPAANQQAALNPGDEAKPENPDAQPPAKLADLPTFPAKTIILGEKGFDDGYLIHVELTTRGAAVSSVKLTDPNFTQLDRKAPLKVVGNTLAPNGGGADEPVTFQVAMPRINLLLEPHHKTLANVDWEIVKQDAASVTFRYPSPAGDLELLRTYKVKQVDPAHRNESPEGYLLDTQFEIKNLTTQPTSTNYTLQGPVGLPLENASNTRVFQEIKLGTLENPRNPKAVAPITMRAADLVKQVDRARNNGKPVIDWREALKFAGVDSQFFAALVLPDDDEQLIDRDGDGHPDPYFSVVRPQLLLRDPVHPDRSELSISFQTAELKIPPEKSVEHHTQTFFGPKRPQLLNPLDAESIIQLGWFAAVAKLMLWVLGFFHSVIGLPYAFAIILLTVVVRGLMFPISRKQALEAEKMKGLAPKLKEIQDKYKNQPEEFAKQYREFQKKYNYHPMMGCLPALIQLPIFLGLYNALYHAVDLRLARFLWIDNLAAPDALFQLGFTVPWLGWTEFNLLPFLTVGLMVLSQKMFTPPPASEEQAMQFRMMNIMMFVIGFAFYRVPAGLCLYFIASSLWGMCERVLLKNQILHAQGRGVADASEGGKPSGGPPSSGGPGNKPADAPKNPKSPGWLERILNAADQAKNATEGQSSQRKFSKDKSNKPKR